MMGELRKEVVKSWNLLQSDWSILSLELEMVLGVGRAVCCICEAVHEVRGKACKGSEKR
jgi:hypothetical protein